MKPQRPGGRQARTKAKCALGVVRTTFALGEEKTRNLGSSALRASNVRNYSRRCITKLPIMTRPTDATMLLLMEDSRVPLRAPDMAEAIDEEMMWMNELPKIVWRTLANIGKVEDTDLICETTRDAHISVAFMHFRVIQVATRRSWTLSVRIVEQNLAELAAEDEPVHHDTVNKHWFVMRDGLRPLVEIEQAVSDGSQLPWVTAITEGQHVCARGTC